ncbi:hypothetical protein FOA52_013801 [Chlamydomonas sp. UWO 241]|nr:hypothetical protein FOA52_013801 [Chlamydomonas sp. UWO 241]
MQNTGCAADNAAVMNAVDAACLNKASCDVSASSTALGISDPCWGTYKWLAITFYCDLAPRNVAPGGGYTAGPACEGQTLHAECPAGQIISDIVTAFYGRSNTVTCPLVSNPDSMQYTWCVAAYADVRAGVHAVCLNEASCDISASHTALGISDPCPGTYKWLAITFNCDSAPQIVVPGGENTVPSIPPPNPPPEGYDCSFESPDGLTLQSACLPDTQSVAWWVAFESIDSALLDTAIKAKSGRAYVESAERMDEEEATAAAAERIAAAAEVGTSLPVRLAKDVVRFLYGGTGRREPADGGVVSASLLNAKPAVGGIGVEPRGGGVLRVLFTVASDAVADTVVRWRHELRRCVDSTAVFDVLSDREEAQHQALWPAFLAAKVAGKRAQFHRARLVVDGERVPAPAC